MSDLVSISLSHIPFLNSCDATRLQMVSKYFGGQSLPHINNDIPKTIPDDAYKVSIYSDRFIKQAKDDGYVVYANNDLMIVYYTNLNEYDVFDVPEYKHISSHFATKLRYKRKTNEKFTKGSILYEYAGFKNGIPAPGFNTRVLFIPFQLMNYEDAIIISESFAKKFKNYTYETITVPIYPNSILKMNAHGKLLPDIGDEFNYGDTILSVGTFDNKVQNIFNFLLDISKSSSASSVRKNLELIKAKVVNVEVHKLSKKKTLIDAQTQQVLDVRYQQFRENIEKVYDELKNNINDEKLVRNIIKKFYTINKSSRKIKNVNDAVYFIKIDLVHEEEIWEGDKFSTRGANKGVTSIILPDELMPKDENGKPYDMIISPFAIPSRMNTNQIYEALVNNFVQHIEDELLQGNVKKAFDMILDIQSIVGKSFYNRTKRFIELLDNDDNLFKAFLEDVKKNGLYIVVDSFKDKNVSRQDIEKLYEKYNIPLMSKVKIKAKEITKYITGIEKDYLPDEIEIEAFSGILYTYKLFKIARYILNARSIGPYHKILKVPTRGRSNQGGCRIGNNEFDMLLTFDSKYVVKEFITVKSDDHIHKEEFLNTIIQGHEYSIKDIKPESFIILTINSLAKTMFVDLENAIKHIENKDDNTTDKLERV